MSIPKINETWLAGERITSTRLNKINGAIDASIDVINPLQTQVATNTQNIQSIAVTGGASVAGSVIFDDGQNAEYKVGVIEKESAGTYQDISSLIVHDISSGTTMGGQPMVLFGAGTPQESVVPTNWNQFDPDTEEGSNWTGLPTMLGQRYVNTVNVSSNTCSEYIAVRDGVYGLKWILI